MADKKKEQVTFNPPAPAVTRSFDNGVEYGRVGQKKYSGVFFEEFVTELRGAQGVKAFQEMYDNDDAVGAVMFAIENLIGQADFRIEPAGDTEQDKRAAEFVEECMDDMQETWTDTLSDMLSFLTFGWSLHEIVYKRRRGRQKDKTLTSKYDDGLIGWKKIAIRSQDTLQQWEYDEYDDLVGMTQCAPPDFAMRTIPIGKCIHLKTKNRKSNPEGRSILRNAYRSWYFKKRFQEIEAIGIERDLAGLPVLIPPEGVDIWDTDDAQMVQMLHTAEKLVSNIRRDAKEGLVLPFGWKFELLNGGSRRQFEVGSTIARYDKAIATTVLADFILLGHDQVGSFALSSDKTRIFSVAIGTFMDKICEAFNSQAIPALIDLNGAAFDKITGYPTMSHGDIEKPEIDKAATFIKEMTGIGILTPDEQLEDFVRELGSLPKRMQGDMSPAEYAQKTTKNDRPNSPQHEEKEKQDEQVENEGK